MSDFHPECGISSELSGLRILFFFQIVCCLLLAFPQNSYHRPTYKIAHFFASISTHDHPCHHCLQAHHLFWCEDQVVHLFFASFLLCFPHDPCAFYVHLYQFHGFHQGIFVYSAVLFSALANGWICFKSYEKIINYFQQLTIDQTNLCKAKLLNISNNLTKKVLIITFLQLPPLIVADKRWSHKDAVIVKPGSDIPPIYLHHNCLYYLGYCSIIRQDKPPATRKITAPFCHHACNVKFK